MNRPILNIKEIVEIKTGKSTLEEIYNKSYSHKPHLAELPHDRRSNNPEELQERIDKCDEKIKETETKIKEMEDSVNYDKNIYKKAKVDELLKNCEEFIDGKYSEKELLKTIRENNPEWLDSAKSALGRNRQYQLLIDSIKSIHPELSIDEKGFKKNHPLDLENISNWYHDNKLGQKYSELQWISGMLTQFDHEGGGTSGPPGAELVPWTVDVRKIAEGSGNKLWRDARNHAHITSRVASHTGSVLRKASTEKSKESYDETELENEKTKLQDYKDEKKRTQDKLERVS